MKNQTIAQQLGIKVFPFTIKDDNYHYYENNDGYWEKRRYNSNGKQIYFENSSGYWFKSEFNNNGKKIYYENSNGYWSKSEYDSNNKEIYFENSNGVIIDKRPKVVELSIEEIAKKLGIDSKLLKIIDK